MSRQERVPVVEPALVPDTFVTGMLPLEDHGAVMRLVLYADHIVPDTNLPIRVIVARLVIPRDCLAACHAQTGREMWKKPTLVPAA